MQKTVGGRGLDVFLGGDPYSGSVSEPPPFELAVAWGLLAPNYQRAFGTGFAPDVDTGTVPQDAWGGVGLFPWINAPTELEMFCTNTADTALGTGARSVTFYTLDSSYNSVPQTVATNGSVVALPIQAIANNGGRIVAVGSGGTNAGDIILRDAGGGATRGIIVAGTGVMRQAPYTVPAGFTLAVPWILIGVDSPTGAIGKFASISTYFKFFNGGAEIQPLRIGNTNGAPYNHFSNPPITIPEKSRFALRINTVSDSNTIVTAGWNGILRANVQTL